MLSPTNDPLELRLKECGVRPSAIRKLVLRVLDAASAPLSVQDIENQLQTVDRSSVSRSLAAFTTAELIHTITDGSGSVKYELCRQGNGGHHSDEHVHFRCERCGRTICLPQNPVPEVKLPEGYTFLSANFIITGVCPKCRCSGHTC